MLNFIQTFKQNYIVNFWDVGKSMIALGILSAVFFGIFGAVWAVTGEMTRWGGEFLELFGVDLSHYSYYNMQGMDGTPLTRRDGLMLIGMFIGCTVAALMANKVKFRLPASSLRVFQAIVGGILSGYGARLAFGCNLADFFTGIPYFSFHTWVFTVFMVLGIYVSVKVTSSKYFLPRAKMVPCTTNKNLKSDKSRAKIYFWIGIAIFIVFVFWALNLLSHSGAINLKDKKSLLGLALIFGFGFGYVVSRGQVCFTSCFRDLILFGRTTSIKGAIFAMIIASLIAFAFILSGNNPKIVEISLGVMIGAFLFGFGIVFAGGCECGWTYRMCEGQVHFFIVGIANFVGTAILATTYDFYPKFITEGVKINLLQEFGAVGGLFVNISLLVATLVVAIWFSTRFFKKKGINA